MIPGRRGRKELSSDCRHRVSFQARTLTADGEGGHTEAWETIVELWAAVYPIKAEQLHEYNQINVLATHIINIRGLLEVDITATEDRRFLFGTRIFEILTIENIQERDIIRICTCKERRD